MGSLGRLFLFLTGLGAVSASLTGCATTYSGVCKFKDDPPYEFKNREIRFVKSWELWVRTGDHSYFLFEPSSCKIEKD